MSARTFDQKNINIEEMKSFLRLKYSLDVSIKNI